MFLPWCLHHCALSLSCAIRCRSACCAAWKAVPPCGRTATHLGMQCVEQHGAALLVITDETLKSEFLVPYLPKGGRKDLRPARRGLTGSCLVVILRSALQPMLQAHECGDANAVVSEEAQPKLLVVNHMASLCFYTPLH